MKKLLASDYVFGRLHAPMHGFESTIVREATGFYGMMEIGCVGGLLPKPLPDEFQEAAREELGWLLPRIGSSVGPTFRLLRLFNARLENRWGQLDAEGSVSNVGVLAELVMIDRCLKDDRGTSEIYGALVRVERPLMGLRVLQDVNAALMGEHSWSAGWRGAIDTIRGFVEFLDLLTDIGRVMEQAGNDYVRSAIWHHYSELLGQAELPEILASIEHKVIGRSDDEELDGVDWVKGMWMAAFNEKLEYPLKMAESGLRS